MTTQVPIQLSKVKPDFESIILQLQIYLRSKPNAWQDLQTSGTGEALVEMIAAIGTMNAFGLEGAFREAFPRTAARDSSIYAGTDFLGVRVHRNKPAGVPVELVRVNSDLSVIVDKFTEFTIDGKKFFNRSPLMFTAGSLVASERVYYGRIRPYLKNTQFKLNIDEQILTTLAGGDKFKFVVNVGGGKGQSFACELIKGGEVYFELLDNTQNLDQINGNSLGSLIRESVELYEGSVLTTSIVADGQPFKRITLPVKGFRVSDIDVEVNVVNEDTGESELWEFQTEGLWNASATDRVYYDYTSGFGEAVITFGDGFSGAAPTLGSKINIRYIETNGSLANNGLQGLDVACIGNSDYTGRTLSSISGGADPKASKFYKNYAPYIFKAKNRAVTPNDYTAIALDYPGVVSVKIEPQRKVAPNDVRWMNVIRCTLLPLDTSLKTLSNREKDDFVLYMEQRAHAAVHIILNDAEAEIAMLDMVVSLKRNYTPSVVLPKVEAALRAMFKRQSDTLGRRIPESDIVNTAKDVEGVDYVTINVCKLYTASGDEIIPDVARHDLIPTKDTNFIELQGLALNSKYSERVLYAGEE